MKKIIAVYFAIVYFSITVVGFSGCSQKKVESNPEVLGQENTPPLSTPPVDPTIPTPEIPTPVPSTKPRDPAPVPPAITCNEMLTEEAHDFSFQATGDLEFDSTHVPNRVAVAGNADVVKSEIGLRLSANKDRVDLAVGGRLKGKRFQIPNGAGRSGVEPSIKEYIALGSVEKGPSIDFGRSLRRQSTILNTCRIPARTNLAEKKCEMIRGKVHCDLLLNGTEKNLNVFVLNAQGIMDGKYDNIVLNIPADSEVLIRVFGPSLKLSKFQTILPSNIDPVQVMWVFMEATEIKFSKSSFIGGILAPSAKVTLDQVEWAGFLMAKEVKASDTTLSSPFAQF